MDAPASVLGQKGYVDYVLFGKGKHLWLMIEAKRTSKDPIIGRKQAMLYADYLQEERENLAGDL